MKITILDNSKIKYNDRYLTPFQTYADIDDATCAQLIASGDAKYADESIAAAEVAGEPEAPKTPDFDPKANGGYVAEAVISPEQRAKLEAEGKLNDDTPVIGQDNTQPKDTTPEPEVKTEVLGEDGKPMTPEQIQAAAEQARAASARPTGEASDPDKAPTVGELQDSGEVVTP